MVSVFTLLAPCLFPAVSAVLAVKNTCKNSGDMGRVIGVEDLVFVADFLESGHAVRGLSRIMVLGFIFNEGKDGG